MKIKEIENAANNLFNEYGINIRKHDVRIRIMLNHTTINLNDWDKDKIVDRIWRKINLLK